MKRVPYCSHRFFRSSCSCKSSHRAFKVETFSRRAGSCSAFSTASAKARRSSDTSVCLSSKTARNEWTSCVIETSLVSNTEKIRQTTFSVKTHTFTDTVKRMICCFALVKLGIIKDANSNLS